MTFSTVDQAVAWLDSQETTIIRRGLDKIRLAMEYFDNPHFNLPVIHITGTNGKGSTTSYLKQLLLSQGLAVGSFTSPHIMRFNERISYNGQDISDEDIIDLTEQMVKLNEYMASTEYGRLVFFELYTVMMALYFNQKQPDVCLIEVGIGGENDCTNVFDGQLAIITTIGLDHEDKLGDTVELVAQEKSGIIKENAIVVTGPIAESPLRVIQDKIASVSGKHYKYNADFGYENIRIMNESGTDFDFWNKSDMKITLAKWNLTMLGKYQVDNASIALKSFLEWMRYIGKAVDLASAREALSLTTWYARMEKMSDSPLIYIDGAHNVHGLIALRGLVNDYFPKMEITILYAGLTTKNQEEQLPLLMSFNPSRLYLTEFGHNNAMSLSDFYQLADESVEINESEFELIKDWQSYVYEFISINDPDQMLLITGSLYFASEVRQLLMDKVKI